MRGYCPLGKMSCIGRYRRNVLSLKQTMYWTLLWCLSGVVDICLESLFIHYKDEWSRETLFLIWNTKGFLCNEGLHMIIPLALSVPEDQTSGNLDNTFYVRKPIVLIPRRPLGQNIFEPSEPSFVRHFMYIKTTSPEKSKGRLAREIEIKTDKTKPSKKESSLFESYKVDFALSIPILSSKTEPQTTSYCKVHESEKFQTIMLKGSKDETCPYPVLAKPMTLVPDLVIQERGAHPQFFKRLSSDQMLSAQPADPPEKKIHATLPRLDQGLRTKLSLSRFYR